MGGGGVKEHVVLPLKLSHASMFTHDHSHTMRAFNFYDLKSEHGL